jgi:signal transduction protein with GAF and PtsI domain
MYILTACPSAMQPARDFAAILSQPHATLTLMPRYFFNTRIDGQLIRDPDGAELRDPDHAWNMARAMIRDILHDESNEPRLLRAAIEVLHRGIDRARTRVEGAALRRHFPSFTARTMGHHKACSRRMKAAVSAGDSART